MNTVLLVTYAFPPRNIVGAIRPLKFARYLPEFGWRPIVLTVREGVGWSGGTDQALVNQLAPNTRIVRSPAIEPPYRLASGLAGGRAGQPPSLAKRMLRAVRTAFLIPDDKIGWLPFALWQGLRILRQERVEAILATSPPPTCLLIASCLSRWARCPLVVDFRDPWTQFSLHQWLRHPLRRRIEEALEHGVLRRASRVITVTPPRTEALAGKYPDIPDSRFVTITNGFDITEYGPPAPAPRTDRFKMVYTGSFYYHRQPHVFLQTLRDLVRENQALRHRVQVVFAGTSGAELTQWASENHLENVVSSLGYLTHQESIALQKSADVLLLFLGDSPMASTWYPAKIFEYLATGRPILALAPEGIAADLVREAGTGTVAHPEDAGSIRRALLDLLRRWEEGRLPTLADPEFPLRFEHRTLTRHLAGVLEEVTTQSSARPSPQEVA